MLLRYFVITLLFLWHIHLDLSFSFLCFLNLDRAPKIRAEDLSEETLKLETRVDSVGKLSEINTLI